MRRPWDKARFDELLEQVMQQAASSYEDLARRSGINSSTFSRWRASKVAPDFDTVLKLARWIHAEHPDLSGAASGLIRAAGFGTVDLAEGAEPLPPLVRENWHDENVRTLWNLRVGLDQRLSLIEAYLEDKAEPANGGNVRRRA